MATDLRKEIRKRLAELKVEAAALEKALAALEGVNARPARRGPGRPPARRGPGRPPAAVKRRRRRGGTRAEQALELIKANPGITVTETAKRIGIQPNYMYRVVHELRRDRLIRKKGKGYAAV